LERSPTLTFCFDSVCVCTKHGRVW